MDFSNPNPQNAEALDPSKSKRLDTEEAQLALEHVKLLIRKHYLVENLVHNQESDPDDRKELVENLVKKQHDVELQNFLNPLHPVDIAYILDSLPHNDRLHVWNLVHAMHDGEVLLEVSDRVREDLIASMNHEDLLAAAENLDTDELADLAPDLPPSVVAEVQKGLTDKERSQLVAALGYQEGTVGAIMDFEMLRVREDVTLEVVLRYLRQLKSLPDHTDKLFVIDNEEHLLGVLSISDLLLNQPTEIVKNVMRTNVFSLNPEEDDTVATSAFERYDLVSAPVLDNENRLIARVTINDVLDVIQEDSQEMQLASAGLSEEDTFSSVGQAVGNRTPWLLLNLCTASIATFIASMFEDTVSKIVILAFLMSIVAGIGGNSGNQTLTIVIRALSMGRIQSKHMFRLIRREALVTLLVGLLGSIIASGFAWFISGSYQIALVMVVAMVLNMLIGACLGVIIPMVRDKLNKDPAMGSSVLLTFFTDALGFFIFLGLASIFLL